MSTPLDPNDELCRLWQSLDRPLLEKEKHTIMELVETRAKAFDRSIHNRNLREYLAASIMAVLFAFFAWNAPIPLLRIGFAIISVSCAWIVAFMWWMQRSGHAPLPESSGEVFKKELLAKYDRQILLTRTAWAWYVLPPTTGLVVVTLANDHSPRSFTFAMAAFMIIVGLAVAILNWRAASKLATEKRDLQRMLEGGN